MTEEEEGDENVTIGLENRRVDGLLLGLSRRAGLDVAVGLVHGHAGDGRRIACA